jgi:hypothetical protein
MLRFLQYVTEETLYYLLEGPPAPGNQLFHKDIGIPPPVSSGPQVGLRLTYRGHPIDRATQKEIGNLPQSVPANYTLIEVESSRGVPVKWVIRVPYDNADDLVIVLLPTGIVKTVWKNHRNDVHRTLNRSIYTMPVQFKKG